ncbi:unnamed protein product, partial [Hapterophycus canaliculatus]
ASSDPDSPLPPHQRRVSAVSHQANEADVLLSMMEHPGSFATVVVKTLKGYFMLRTGKEEQEVFNAVVLPVAKALEADPGVLNFPLCWTMCQCVHAFLLRKGCHAAAGGMDKIMRPLRSALAYSNSACGVALKVFGVYAGKGTAVAPHNGLFSSSAPSPPRTSVSVSRDVGREGAGSASHSRGGGGGGSGGGS